MAEEKTIFSCAFCDDTFPSKEELSIHLDAEHFTPPCQEFCDRVLTAVGERLKPPFVIPAFNGKFLTYVQHFNEGSSAVLKDPFTLLCTVRNAVFQLLDTSITRLKTCKAQLCLFVVFEKKGKEQEFPFCSYYKPLCISSKVSTFVDEAYEKIHKSIQKFTREGSGWTIASVSSLRIKVGRYDPFQASSYIQTPKKLRKKSEYIVNVRNTEDNKCFLYSVLASLRRTRSSDPLTYVDHTLDDSMLQYPVQLNAISNFEDKNRLSINVIGYTEEHGIHPLRCAPNVVGRQPVHLLYMSDDAEEPNYHYCAILDLGGFLKFHGTGTNKKYYCLNCFSHFTREYLLTRHRRECLTINSTQALTFLKPGENVLKFERFERQNPHTWVVYADFECMLVPVQGPLPSSSQSATTNISKHVPISYGYVVIGPHDDIVSHAYYYGKDAVEHFVDCLKKIGDDFRDILSNCKPMKLTTQEKIDFNDAKTCHYCGKSFNGVEKVRDHCHWTGEFRGAACNKCNLNAREIKTIPVCFHGLTNYDSHLLVMAIQKFQNEVRIIARNSERFQSMSVNLYSRVKGDPPQVTLRFIDTFGFLNTSLATLAENYKKSGGQFNVLKESLQSGPLSKLFPIYKDKILEMLTLKGHYPYEYVTNESVFEETEVPPKEAFYSTVKEEGISDEEYGQVIALWDQLTNKIFASYHAVYQLVDVYILAQVFQRFRRLCLENYRLDPCYYVSTPGFSWAAALCMTTAELELFTHVNKHNFISSGIRGGLSYIAKRHAVANNSYVDGYDPSKPSIFLLYADANNLYGRAMTEPLPCSHFMWLTKKEIQKFEVNECDDHNEYGYILMVDLDYPEHLHESHSDYPLAPQKLTVEDVSGFTERVAEEIGHNTNPTVKLVSTLYNKKKYVVHYRNLKFYLKHGMILRHIHRILRFRQQPWLQSYIEANTEKRQNATNTFEKDFYKLLNNSVFGKTIENKQNRKSVKLVKTASKCVKYTSLPYADSFQTLSKDLISVLLKARTVKCDLPTYLGFSILDLSKLVMYQFHYEYILPTYGNKAKLLFTDTDSLAYEIETQDLYEDMRKMDRFDTSNYPSNHPSYTDKYKQKLGYFKDEQGGDPMVEFIGLRAKMYSFTTKNQQTKQTAKGIKKSYIKHHITHNDYKECLQEHIVKTGTWATIASKSHQITTDIVNKKLLSPYDDKRYIADDGVTTYAHGHYKFNGKVLDDQFDSDIDVDIDLEETEKRAAKDIEDAERQDKMEARINREEEEKLRKADQRRLKTVYQREKRKNVNTKEKDKVKEEDRKRRGMRQAKMDEDQKMKAKDRDRKRKATCSAGMTDEERAIANAKRRRLYAEKKIKEHSQ